jgi:hypothetical protein
MASHIRRQLILCRWVLSCQIIASGEHEPARCTTLRGSESARRFVRTYRHGVQTAKLIHARKQQKQTLNMEAIYSFETLGCPQMSWYRNPDGLSIKRRWVGTGGRGSRPLCAPLAGDGSRFLPRLTALGSHGAGAY